nr:rhabdomeric opsin [Paramacrobiotus areolatus]
MVSVSTMACIAVDRCLSITRCVPKWHLTYSRVGHLLFAIWLYGIILVTPPLFGWSDYVLEGLQTSCTFNFLSRRPENISFTLYLFTIGFFLPLFVIAVCYVMIIRYIVTHREMMLNVVVTEPVRNRLLTAGSPTSRRTDVKAAVICAVIIALFCLAWFPYACLALISTFGRPDLVNPYINALPSFFSKSSVIYNPLVHSLMNRRFRTKLLEMFRCGRQTENQRVPRVTMQRNESLIARITRTKRLSSGTSTTRTSSLTGQVPISPTDHTVGFASLYTQRRLELTGEEATDNQQGELLYHKEMLIETIKEASNENDDSSAGLMEKQSKPCIQSVEVELHGGQTGSPE